MCGIAGFLTREPPQLDPVFAALRHRGPDGSGLWQRDTGSFRLQLLHTRLAILDLSGAADQPMSLRSNPEGTWSVGFARTPPSLQLNGEAEAFCLVYNGEIYNFRELRAELSSLGWSFQSTGDTEVVLKGYAQWGTDFFRRCDGIFALALWDEARQALILARDHLGIKPLYYAPTQDGGFAFASEVRALLASQRVNPALDPDAVAGYLRFGSFQEPHTLHTAVRCFPPGCFARLFPTDTPPALRCERYWDLASQAALRQDHPSHPRDHHAQLAASVRAQCVSDVPVGLFLSGGLDSTVILETLAHTANGKVTAFTLGGVATRQNESCIARQTAANLGLPHVTVDLTQADLTQWVEDGIHALDQASCDGLNLYLISRAARSAGLIVVLAGTGADELHGAYGHVRLLSTLHHLHRGSLGTLPYLARCFRPLLRRRYGPVWTERFELLLSQGASPSQMVWEKRRFFTPSQIRHWWPEAPPCATQPQVPPLPALPHLHRLDPRDQISLAEIAGYLANTLLRDGDSASMANSQEMRVPYLGRAYVEYMLALPWTSKAPRGPSKPLLRALTSPVNQHLLALPKTGFSLDFGRFLATSHRAPFLESCLHLNRTLGFHLEPEKVLKWVDAGDPRVATRAWALFMLASRLRPAAS